MAESLDKAVATIATFQSRYDRPLVSLQIDTLQWSQLSFYIYFRSNGTLKWIDDDSVSHTKDILNNISVK